MKNILRNVPIWLVILALAIEVALGLLFVRFYQQNLATAGYMENRLRGLLQIESEIVRLQKLAQFRGACTSRLVDPANTSQSLIELCEAQYQELTNSASQDSPIPSPQGEANHFFNHVTQYNQNVLVQIDRLASVSGTKYDVDPLIDAADSLFEHELPWLMELIGQVRGAVSLYLEGYVSRDFMRDLLGNIRQIYRLSLRKTELLSGTTQFGELSKEMEAVMFDSEQYFNRIEREANNNYIHNRQYYSEIVMDLFDQGSRLIGKIKTINSRLYSSIVHRVRSQIQNYKYNLIIIIATSVVVQIFIALLIVRLILLYKKSERDRCSAIMLAGQLEELIEKQDRMFAIVAHELRTPAASLKMLSDEKLSDADDELLKEIHDTAQHLLDVIDDMSLSKRQDLLDLAEQERVFSVFQLLKECIHATTAYAINYGFRVDLVGKRASALGHTGAPKILRQIALNLIKNGLIHSQGNELTVQLEHDRIDERNTYFRITFRDNGTGIPKKDRERLFDAFERGDTVSKGSGLGLHVCKELAKTLPNGDLKYRDNYSGGSIFELSFTLPRSKSPTISSECSSESILYDKKVLLIEDTPTLRMLSAKVLEKAGACVSTANDGREGLQRFLKSEFDLVITDIMMPNMNGYELTRTLRELDFMGPIIGVTGATLGKEAEKLLEAGADEVLPKPLEISSVNEAMIRLST